MDEDLTTQSFPDRLASLIEPMDLPGYIADQAISHGFLLSPGSRIRRAMPPAGKIDPSLAPFLSAEIFTLQWHVTQACDLDCLHCCDRIDRTPLALDTAMAILGDFYDFCRRMHVRGQVTFTGGNPLLYPHFDDVYRAASQFGFGIAILGNPTPLDRIRRLLEIDRPLYFQISLEGLEAHNDTIRGKGHFARSLAFLEGLQDNLINLVRQEENEALFGGCTGHGCGAAFNFLALLPDGEVHACRKFPSLVGNITKHRLYDIYRSELAERYRAGSQACLSCHLNPVCRGCLAIVFSLGLDVFTDKDPFCFASQQVAKTPEKETNNQNR